MKRFKTASGFTILELMVVLIILSLTAGTVVPRIGSSLQKLEERDFVQEYVRTLRRARLRAMNSGEVVVFRIRSGERLYGLESPPEKSIPENVDIFADRMEEDPETGDFLIYYYPDGSHSTVGDMELVFNKSNTYEISIHPLFGNVAWSRKGGAQ